MIQLRWRGQIYSPVSCGEAPTGCVCVVLVRVHGGHAVCINKLGKREILKRILLQRLRRRAICNAADKPHQSKRFEWEWPLCRERGGARYYGNGGT